MLFSGGRRGRRLLSAAVFSELAVLCRFLPESGHLPVALGHVSLSEHLRGQGGH